MRWKWSIQGAIVLLVLLFGVAYLTAGTTPIEGKESQTDNSQMLRVLLGDTIEEIPMEEYLVGVLRAEMPASFEVEALKAQAVCARSYTLYKMRQGAIANHPEADTCDQVNCCKAYLPAEAAAVNWGERTAEYEAKLKQAVKDTAGLVATYEGEPILAVFHSSAAGQTQNVEAVWQSPLPYLRSVSSPETAESVPNYYSSVTIPVAEAKQKLSQERPQIQLEGNPTQWVTEQRSNEQGLVTAVVIGGESFSGNQLRTLFGLRSACFTVQGTAEGLHFSVTGYGHGVGLSQYGANALAKQGMDFREILTWYYTGIQIEAYTE